MRGPSRPVCVSCRAFFHQLYVGQDSADGGAADFEAAGDFGFADAGPVKLPDLPGLLCRGSGSTQFRSFAAGFDESGADAFAEDFVFELGEDRQQSRHRTASWRGQIQRFGQRHETDAEFRQFFECNDQISE
jgi:hypothetical protein